MTSRIFTHLVLVLGLFSAVSLKAQQVTFTISPNMVTPNVGDTVRLNVVVTNFTNVVSFQYAMDWDANLFQFVSFDNKDNMPDKQNLDFNNYTPSAAIVAWNSVGSANRTVANGTVIYRLNLKVKATSTNYWAKFTNEGVSLEVIQNGTSVTPSFGNLGNPPDGSSIPVTVKTSSHTILANESICVGVTADKFTDMITAKWQMKWDSTVLRFESLTKLNTTLALGLNTNFVTTQAVTNGRLNFNWTSAIAKTIPTGDTLYKVCFTGIGASGTSTTISTLQTNAELTRSNAGSSTVVGLTPQNGTVNISTLPPSSSGLTFSGTTVTGKVGDTVCVKIYAKNFKDLAITGFSMHWDSTKLSFGKAHILNAAIGQQDSLVLPDPTTTTTYVSPNSMFVYKTTLSGTLVYFNDMSGLNNGNGVTLLGDSSLVFDVCLRINSGTGTTVPFTFNGTPFKISILDKDVNKITTTFTSGKIIIENAATPAIVATGSVTNANCNGGADGGVALTVSGGTGTFIYTWTGPNSFSAATKDIANLKAGKYFVTISSGAATPKVDSFTVTQPVAVSVSKTITNVNCFGAATGTIVLTPSGGTAPYTYTWSSGETTKDLASKAAGRYIVTILDSKSCSIKDTSDITQPTAITATKTVTNVACFGTSTGSVTLTPSGGTAPYTYTWSSGETTKDLASKAAGRYIVTILDSKSCSIKDTSDITQPTAISATRTVTNVSCGQTTGSVALSVTGGSAPYTYSWSSGETSKDITNKAAGRYIVTILDSKSCSIKDTAFILEPVAMTTTKTVVNNNCFGQTNGSVTLTVAGGTAPYTYSWSSGETSKDITNKPTGRYIVSILDAQSCTLKDTTDITAPAAISATKIVTNVNCFGQTTGSVTLTPAGGTAPYTYSWSSGETSKDIANKAAGKYIVTISDSKSCSTKDTSDITQPVAAIGLSQVVTNVACNGASTGAINLSVAGGTPSFTYSWTGSNGFTATTEDLSNLKAGGYSVTVTDSKGCAQTLGPIAVGESAAMTVIPTVTNSTCGQTNGAITIAPAGGTAPYTFKWTGSNGYSATTQNISNLTAGSYTVEITDAGSCKLTSAPISVSSANPTFSLSNVVTNSSCNGGDNGSVALTVTGGTGNFTYNWAGSNAFAATTKNISNLKAGSYIVTVTETGTGCQVVSSAITVTEPTVLTIGQPQKTDVKCKDETTGFISINVSGGNGSYTYSWTGPNNFTATNTPNIGPLKAGTYNVTVTDAKGCTANTSVTISEPTSGVNIGTPSVTDVICNGGTNGSIVISVQGGTPQYSFAWSNQSVQQNLSNITAGIYVVTVTDGNSCKTSKSIEVKQPAAMVISGTISTSVIGCIGTITLSVSGGTLPYSYAWTGSGITNPTNKDQSNLCPNETYSVTVTDGNNCTSTKQFTITGQIAPPIRLTDSTVVSQAGCPGQNLGAINIAFTGGKSPFSFEWMNAAGAIVWREQNLRDRTAGRYRIKIIDGVGQSYLSGEIEIKESASTINIGVAGIAPESCEGNNGEITLSISGGSAPYKFVWNDGLTSQDRRNIKAGTYAVTVSDAGACLTEKGGLRVEKQLCALSITSSNKGNNCFGDKNGTITVNIQNGEPGYTIRWSATDSVRVNNSPRKDATYEIRNLASGTYVVTITDSKGQVTTVTEEVKQPSEITITKNVSNDAGNCSGSIVLSVTGGSPTYSYVWNDGALSRDRFNICANSILSVTITDSKGCFKSTANDTIRAVVVPSACANVRINTNFEFGYNLKCANDRNGSATITAVSNVSLTPPYQYRWDNGETGPTSVQLVSGARTVTVVGANGRTCVANFIMSAPQEIKVLIIPNIQDCALVASATGGVTPYSYQWSTAKGDTTAKIGGLKSLDKFFVIVKDKFGCTTDPGIGTAECQEFCLKGPGVLTPNEDGKNDKFAIQRCDYKNVQLRVYSRWGQLVYENNDYLDQWEGNEKDGKNGKELPEGVYMYILRALQPNGIEKVEKNTISILRQQ